MYVSPRRFAILFGILLAPSLGAQSTPEQLCGRDILTIGDAWENVQVEHYEFERILSSGSMVLWPQRMAALVSHLRFMERRAQLPQAERDRIAVGVQLVAGRTLPSNQFALGGDAAGLRAELSQIEAGTALVGQQFPGELLKPLVPLTHLLAPLPPQLVANLGQAPVAMERGLMKVTFKLEKQGGGIAGIGECHAFLVSKNGDDFDHAIAKASGEHGELSAEFALEQGGQRRLWVAATPLHTGREELLGMDLPTTTGAPPIPVKETMVVTRSEFKAELRFMGGAPRAGEIAVARLILTARNGQPMKPLESIFGGPTYLIAFSNDLNEAIPIRPTGTAAQPEIPGSIEIDFRFRPLSAGRCHLFAEVRTNGADDALAFTFPVRETR